MVNITDKHAISLSQALNYQHVGLQCDKTSKCITAKGCITMIHLHRKIFSNVAYSLHLTYVVGNECWSRTMHHRYSRQVVNVECRWAMYHLYTRDFIHNLQWTSYCLLLSCIRISFNWYSHMRVQYPYTVCVQNNGDKDLYNRNISS